MGPRPRLAQMLQLCISSFVIRTGKPSSTLFSEGKKSIFRPNATIGRETRTKRTTEIEVQFGRQLPNLELATTLWS